AAVDRRHFDFRAERCLAYRDRHFCVDVVAAALEEGMRPYLHAQIQIARRRTHRSRVSFTRTAQPRAVGQSRRNPQVDGSRATHAPFPAAGLAWRANLSGAAAARARNVETHLAGGLLDGSAAVANRAGLRRYDRARAVAGFAGIEPRHLQLLYRPAHGIPKITCYRVFQVAAGFLLRLHGAPAATATAKELAEEITETARAGAFAARAAKIESPEIEIHRGFVVAPAAGRRGPWMEIVAVEAVLVVHLPLLGVGEDVVGFLKLLEFFLSGFIAGIQVRVIFAREFAKGVANVLRTRLARNSQQLVVILFGRGGHLQPEKTLQGRGISAPLLMCFLVRTLGFVDIDILGVDNVVRFLLLLRAGGRSAACSGARPSARCSGLRCACGLVSLVQHLSNLVQLPLDALGSRAQPRCAAFVHGLLGILDGLIQRLRVRLRDFVAVFADHLLRLIHDAVQAIARVDLFHAPAVILGV